jgi:very-short-patch-repair endonuclease
VDASRSSLVDRRTLWAMDSRAAALMSAQGGVVGTCQLNRLDVSSQDVATWVSQSEVVRVRRGAYVDARSWDSADPGERYRLTVMAAMRSRGGVEAASHQSALALHRLPLWHVNRALVILMADVEESTTTRGVRLMPLRSLVAETEVGGLRTLTVPDAVVTVSSVSVEGGVVAGDAAMHEGGCTIGQLHEAAERLAPGLRGRARLRRALTAMDGRSESPGESRTRMVLSALGLPVESQVDIIDARGEFVGRVDFLVAGRVVVEFDGAVKYQGDSGPDVLVAEKRREDWLRELGYEVVRVTWDELERPGRIHAKVRAALLRRAA